MKFGYQTIRWGWERVAEKLPEVLDQISVAGFEAAEVNDVDIIPYLDDPQAVSNMLSEKKIPLVGLVTYSIRPLLLGSLNPYRVFTWRQIKKLMKFASIVGCEKFILAGPVTGSARTGVKEKEYAQLTKVLTKIGEECGKLQMEASYHPISGSIGTTIGQIERLLEMTDPELVSLVLDTGHLSVSGLDPLEFISALADRINYVHLKDVKAGVFAELGEGTDLDIPAIIRSIRSTGYNGWVIAEDEVLDTPPPLSLIGRSARSPIETAKNSRKYLDAL